MTDDSASDARRQLGELLFTMRRERGLTFTQLQAACGILVSQQENWENGIELPSPYDLATLLRELDLGPARNRAIQNLFKTARELTDATEESEAFDFLHRQQSRSEGEFPVRPDRSPSPGFIDRWQKATEQGPGQRAGGIFLSYRRADSAATAGRLYDRLAARFGDDKLFMDVESISPGADFIQVLDAALAEATVMLVLIGRDWLSVSDNSGSPRLFNPEDVVRLEVEVALNKDVSVIPVLVDGAVMPSVEQLPASLGALARRNAFMLSSSRFSTDVNVLVEAIGRILKAKS